jgi:hypothetical protein
MRNLSGLIWWSGRMPDYKVTYQALKDESYFREIKVFKKVNLFYAEKALELEDESGGTVALFAPGEWFNVELVED